MAPRGSNDGLPYWEPERYPDLADYECRHCLQIGEHAVGCPTRRSEMSMTEDLRPNGPVQCRVEGCTNLAPRLGRYAGRCDEHRNGTAVDPADTIAAEDVPAVLDDLGGGELVQAARRVERLQEELHDAIVLLRDMLDQRAEVL